MKEERPTRPDPDQILASVKAEEARARRGKLRIFFGASAGVGKTYSMLEAARGIGASGVDIVVGYVEPHGRLETERWMEEMEQLPKLLVHYRGMVREEFDLDAGLKRRPTILIVDELAHSNLIEGEPAPRHAKRWQDIEEVLQQGINVWTTVNVQHLESLNDLVAQITGVRQRETIPDRIFDEADEVELIDLPPDDLIARLHAGKVYVPEQIATAVERFFRKPNLIALRELALRRMADRVNATARASVLGDRSSRAWMAGDRVLVAIGPDLQAEQVVRAGKRIADALDASWTVVYVETPQLLRMPDIERNRRIELLQMAETLGAETVTIDGPSAADAIVEYARTRKATRIVVGIPKRSGLRALLRRSTTWDLVRRAHDFDVITVGMTDRPGGNGAKSQGMVDGVAQPVHWERYGWAMVTTVICTLVAFAMYPRFELANIVMAYVLGSAIASVKFGRGPAVVAAIANVLAFDFCFVPPRFTFSVADAQYLVTFAVMLTVTILIANLMSTVRQQTRVAGARERRTALLYAMSRELAATRGVENMALVAVRHVAEVFDCRAVVLLPDRNGKLMHPRDTAIEQSFRDADLSIAQWVIDHGKRAGLGSDTLPAAPALYLPLSDAQQRLGVLGILPSNRRRVLLPEQRHLLDTFAGQLGLAMERARLAEQAEHARVTAETESFRNTLLASISHDLRTPLAVIAGAGSTLADHASALTAEQSAQLARSIETTARDMTEMVANVLQLMRLESGRIRLRRAWDSVEEIVGSALTRMEPRMQDHPIQVSLPDDLAPIFVDSALTLQVFVNLLDNAAKYTPAGTRISIKAVAGEDEVIVTVEDNGPGLPPGDPEPIFNKFQRGDPEGSIMGVGLGLAICRAIVRAQGGHIRAGTRPGGGARFQFSLPMQEPVEAPESSR
ncbi:MAG TPA: sensor histidine kinase KdpD [Steroidobacteraceae bacterium]|nr:sensor histidine kinase KdpD [Steroidobacteraceae bacterium]